MHYSLVFELENKQILIVMKTRKRRSRKKEIERKRRGKRKRVRKKLLKWQNLLLHTMLWIS